MTFEAKIGTKSVAQAGGSLNTTRPAVSTNAAVTRISSLYIGEEWGGVTSVTLANPQDRDGEGTVGLRVPGRQGSRKQRTDRDPQDGSIPPGSVARRGSEADAVISLWPQGGPLAPGSPAS